MRVAIFQPLVPSYRIPLYERLGARSDIELTVFGGGNWGSVPALSQGKSFRFVYAPVRHGALGLRVQLAQVQAMIRSRFDFVIAPWDIHYLTTLPTVGLSRARRVPIALWGHGYSQRPHPLTEAARNFVGRCADAVLLYTRSVARELVEQHRFAAERVFVAQNALDQTPIQTARQHWLENPLRLEQFQREHDLDPGQTILFVSRLEPSNRIESVLAATAALSDEFPRLRTVLIGDGSHRAELERTAVSLGIRDRLVFTGALYEEPRVAPWMLSATVLCYPTNIGLSLLHAFGYGLPVITSDDRRSHNPEIEALVPGINGIEYRAGDDTDLIRACAQVLRDPVLRQNLGAAALQTVLERYSMDTMVAGFERLFQWAHRSS